ncbi:ABC transporter ATP-binding protein [Schaedlerella arabinosiphila]|uniref:ABC transporter ATP-binding protein n=1 Tax=Schaedlerella arabinosiphila TaxID=2044587 RepID=A0A9X5H899_9FIRM|nr:ABC transporter ATP-binding protein [Schaedlerella arabinosiphila]KAI4443849.1 Vitamin B12 import ATP-binding protein BtuD [Schaedlerella arabinosiphila]NDO71529.1 ABC transporter ATP-binding protein [Schaedlerella arabinosiphila]
MKQAEQKQESVIQAGNLNKKYGDFQLSIPRLEIPRGFATALIGENGAGKTTLLNILSGIRLDFQGEVSYFGDRSRKLDGSVQERIGYTGPGSYYLPHWTIRQVEEISGLLFAGFQKERFRELCENMGISRSMTKSVKKLSDGNRMKLMLAAVLSRDTELLIMDEPASPLDPLMREQLCDRMRDYLEEGDGERSIFFSTHNIADMENVTDYCLIMEHGTIVEEGFVEDLKEEYALVKGEASDADQTGEVLFSMSRNSYGFEGICRTRDLERLAGLDIAVEIPTLSQICVAVMKANTVNSPRKGRDSGL